MDRDDLSYEGEEIKLDKIRHIKYTIKGLKLLAKKFGSVAKAFEQMQTMNQKMDVDTMDNLTLLLQAGLIHEDNKLTADDIENWLTIENMPVIFGKIIQAFTGSTPQPTGDEVNQDEPGEPKSIST